MRVTLKHAGRLVIIAGLFALLVANGWSTADAQGISHVVKRGESLAMIAQRYGTTVGDILTANDMDSTDLIWVGRRLTIPSVSVADDTAANSTSIAVAPDRIYTVQPGDTLSKIARRLGVSASAIVRANGISNADLLYVGQQLSIPGVSSETATPTPAPAPTPGGQASRLVVSISQQHCWLYQGDAVVGSWACSTGRRGWPTLPGSFKVQSKLPTAYGSTWNIVMPYWLGIYWAGSTENGIHGLPWNATTGARTWDGLVGTPITYGCVMLNDAAAQLVWNMAYIGMPVIIQR
jgi:LysM repeat protein